MKTAHAAPLLLTLLLVVPPAPAADVPKPPVARRVPHPLTFHGETWDDPYFWLRERSDPEVRAYLEAENAYAAAVMEPTAQLQESLYQEMVGRLNESDLTVPYRKGGYLYYSRTEKGKQYPLRCRKKGGLESPEEVTLDLNELARGQRFLGLGGYEVSDDGSLLAYTTDVTGFREYGLHVKDLRSGALLPVSAEKVSSVAWAADGRTLFYVTDDAAKRPSRLFRLELGGGPAVRVLDEPDERFTVRVSRSRSGDLVLVALESHTTSEWRTLSAREPAGPFRTVLPREAGHQYDVDDGRGVLYVRTNKGCRGFRLVTVPAAGPAPSTPAEVLPCREEVATGAVAVFERFVAVLEREEGAPHLRLLDRPGGAAHRVELPDPVRAVSLEANPEYGARAVRFAYQSLTAPPAVYDYDPAARTRALLKETEVPGGYDRTRYASERLFAAAPDGTRVPVSLVYRKGTPRDGTAPALLMGYGAYGASMAPAFSASRLSLLDRGVVYAIAHVRGGGELGPRWHDAGRMMSKWNTFVDFVAAAEALVAEKVAAPGRLAIEGGSAGGLLMGAVTNLAPGLFRAVVARVPFVDVISSMADASLPLTVGEFEEWGNPARRAEFAYLRSYSPYDNLRRGAYPAMLVKTSLDDSQVMYWEPAKYVAKLRTLKTDGRPLLLKTSLAGGHGGASGRYDRLRETAFDTAFVLRELGVVP